MQKKTLEISIGDIADDLETIFARIRQAISTISSSISENESGSINLEVNKTPITIKIKTKNIYMTSQELKDIRLELGLTQEALNSCLNDLSDSGNFISQMETNKRPIPKKTAEKLRNFIEEKRNNERKK